MLLFFLGGTSSSSSNSRSSSSGGSSRSSKNNSGSGNGPSCRAAEIIPLGNNTLYVVGTSVGLFGTAYLNDVNTIWEQIADYEIGAVVCEYLTYRPNDGLLVVATHGNGIYQTNLSSIDDVLDINDFKEDDFKFSIFPNPVIDRLSLSINLDATVDAEIVIYDELGRKVEKDYSKKLYFGENVIELNISDYKSGVYFLSLSINNQIMVQQIIKK